MTFLHIKLSIVNELKTFDASEYLHDDESILIYLNEMLADGDLRMLPIALGTIAKARSMTELSKVTGISRKALYKSLSVGNPRLDTLVKVMEGLKLAGEMQLQFKKLSVTA